MRTIIGIAILVCCCLFCSTGSAQSIADILNASSDTLKKVKTLQYKVSYDRFVGGLKDIHQEARVVLERSPDSLYGMKFIVSNDSFEYIYAGRYALAINQKKAEVMQVNPVLFKEKGIPAFLVKEFFDGYDKEAYKGRKIISEDPNDQYIITYKTGSKKPPTVRSIFINRHNGIPERFESVVTINGKKEVITLTLSDIAINQRSVPAVDTRIMAYLDKYTLLPIEDIGILNTMDARDSLVGKKAPDFLLKTLSDKDIQLSDLKGKLILLDFWEVWCGPCRMSMPHLQELHDQYKDKEFVLLGILKDNVASAKGLLIYKNITYENMVGSDQVARDYRIVEIPQYYLINREGIIIYASKNGFEKKMEDLIRSMVK